MVVKGSHNVFDSFCNTNGCILSDSIDFVVFNSCRIFSTSVTFTSIVPKFLSKFKYWTVGILDTSSRVNILTKHYLVYLLSHYLTVFMFHLFSEYFLLMTSIWSFSLTYFQNLFVVGRTCNNFKKNRAFYDKSMKLGTCLVDSNAK